MAHRTTRQHCLPRRNPNELNSLIALAFLACLVSARESGAAVRHFAYSYESGTLRADSLEFEPHSTVRIGREEYYSRFDERLEFEIGLTDRLQTAIYLNMSAVAAGAPGARELSLKGLGLSSEWKYKLTDPVADVLGSALYLEIGGSPLELELEAKVILDKRLGSLLLSCNLIVEQEWEFETNPAERETGLEVTLGLGYFVTPRLFLGLEARSPSVIEGDEGVEHAALFAGPTLAYSSDSWWTVLSLMPQLTSLAANPGGLDLEDFERGEVRLIVGFHL